MQCSNIVPSCWNCSNSDKYFSHTITKLVMYHQQTGWGKSFVLFPFSRKEINTIHQLPPYFFNINMLQHITLVMKHLEDNQILCNFQYSFRPQFPFLYEALLTYYTYQRDPSFTRLSSPSRSNPTEAFDTVSHSLNYYSITGKLHNWLSTCWAKRTQ